MEKKTANERNRPVLTHIVLIGPDRLPPPNFTLLPRHAQEEPPSWRAEPTVRRGKAQKYALTTSGYYLWRRASRDGFAWTEVGVVQAAYGGETAFLFEPDGSHCSRLYSIAPLRCPRAGVVPERRTGDWTERDLDPTYAARCSFDRAAAFWSAAGRPTPGPRGDGALLARR